MKPPKQPFKPQVLYRAGNEQPVSESYPGQSNEQIDMILSTYPEIVSEAKADWQRAELKRQTIEAKIYLKVKRENPKMSVEEIKATVRTWRLYRKYKHIEIDSEMLYNAKNETLLATKKQAGIRTAF